MLRSVILVWLMAWCATVPARADPMADTLRVMAAIPVTADHNDLVAHLETAGHWSFGNRAGDRFTASGPDEMKRAIASLVTSAKPDTTLSLTLTPPAFHAGGKALQALPQDAMLRTIIADRTVNVTRRQNQSPLAHITSRMAVSSDDSLAFAEAVAHLTRPFVSTHLRVVGFVRAGPKFLSATPRIDEASKRPLVDQLDPIHAAAAITAARGATVVLSGKVTDGHLLVADGAADVDLPLLDLMKATRSAEGRLIVLHTASTAQPGSRNWLWLPVDGPGLTAASTLADALNLTAANAPMKAAAVVSDDRVILTVEPNALTTMFDGSRWVASISKAALDLVGRSPARAMTVSLPLAAHQVEFDRRIFKSIPSLIQYSYAALLILGLAGLPTAWRWFARLWPQELASDYANAAGFHAARAVRATLFAIAFMPLAAIVATPAHLLSLITRRPA